MDSGATSHTIRKRAILTIFVECDGEVSLADEVAATGYGNVMLQLKKGVAVLKDVLLVPDLRCNLISMGCLSYACMHVVELLSHLIIVQFVFMT